VRQSQARHSVDGTRRLSGAADPALKKEGGSHPSLDGVQGGDGASATHVEKVGSHHADEAAEHPVEHVTEGEHAGPPVRQLEHILYLI